MTMQTATIPSDATSLTLTIDRSPLIGGPRQVVVSVEMSLDGGATWGGTFTVEPPDESKPSIQFPLEVGMTIDGTQPLPGMQAVAWRGVEIPPEQGQPRLVRYSAAADLESTLTFGVAPYAAWQG